MPLTELRAFIMVCPLQIEWNLLLKMLHLIRYVWESSIVSNQNTHKSHSMVTAKEQMKVMQQKGLKV